MLTKDEFTQWQREVAAAYRGECPKTGTAELIDCAYARRFVEDCQDELNQIYGRLKR